MEPFFVETINSSGKNFIQSKGKGHTLGNKAFQRCSPLHKQNKTESSHKLHGLLEKVSHKLEGIICSKLT